MLRYGLLFLLGTLRVDAATTVTRIVGTSGVHEPSTIMGAAKTGTSAVNAATRVNVTNADCLAPFVPVGERCVFLDLSVSDDWESMRLYCQALGSDLAVFTDGQFYVDSQQYVRSLGTGGSFWVGASDIEQEGTWVWIDGTPVAMGTPYWANAGCSNVQDPDGETAQNCALLGAPYHHYLIDDYCSGYAHPFCVI